MPDVDERGLVALRLVPFEYEAILCSLEAAVAGMALPEDLRMAARETWERLLVEGGHVTVKEFRRLRKIGR
jgi:hypothetical protein